MPNEVKLLPCVWCEGQTRRFQMKTTEGTIVEMVEHQGWPHCCVRLDSMTLDQWQSRPTTVVTDEVVERELSQGRAANPYPPFSDENGIWNDGFCDAWGIVRAALASMPTVVTGEQPLQSVGDHALPPSGLSQSSLSQASPAAAIARKGDA